MNMNTLSRSELERLPPPNSQEAEQAILGGLMFDPAAIEQIGDKLTPEDFYFRDHRIIFEAIIALSESGKAFDALMVSQRLESLDQLESVGGNTYLMQLVDAVVSAANIGAYAEIVHEAAMRRRLITVSSEIGQRSFRPDGQTAYDVLEYAEKELFAIADAGERTKRGFREISDLLTESFDEISDLYENGGDVTGLSTGFKDLDEITSGLHKGDLVIVAGRPSMGKTTFAMNLAENVAMQDHNGERKAVAVFSMEMPGKQLSMRMLSSVGRIDQTRVRTGKLEDRDWHGLSSAVAQLNQCKIHIDDTPALSPGEMRSRARRLARDNDLGLIVVDYLQLMRIPGSKENRTNEISEISRSLKTLAKELDVTVIALSQLNRSLENRTDKRPVMSDLRESGAIEQDADTIMFIYREEVYDPETPKKGIAEVIIGKQRNGPIGNVPLVFEGQYTRFSDLAHSYHLNAPQTLAEAS